MNSSVFQVMQYEETEKSMEKTSSFYLKAIIEFGAALILIQVILFMI